MKTPQKKLKSVAAKLLEISRDPAGTLDESRIKAILGELPKIYPAQSLRDILKFYYAAVAKELRFHEARIEFVGALPAGTAESLAAHFSKIYDRKIVPVATENPALLGGLRVSVGDDVYDATIARMLKSLA